MHLPKNEGGNFTPAPAGTHIARCYRFVDMGSHEQTFQGESKGLKRLVILSFELCNELMPPDENGIERPFTVSKRYTWSMHEKANLRKDLESWRGKKFDEEKDFGPDGFNVKKLLGVPATITVTHDESDGKTYTNITGIGGMMKGVEAPEQVNQSVYVALTKEDFNQSDFEMLHENLREKIMKTPEYQGLFGDTTPVAGPQNNELNPPPVGEANKQLLDDEIPFAPEFRA